MGRNRSEPGRTQKQAGGKLVGNRSVTGGETDEKRVGHGSETGFLQGFSRVSLVFLEVFFTVSIPLGIYSKD